MRDPKRIPRILEKLRQLWEQSPDLRLGQLVENCKSFSELPGAPTFYLEDDEMEKGIDAFIGEHKELNETKLGPPTVTFLEEVRERARKYGWSFDYCEIGDFVERMYKDAGVPISQEELEPYPFEDE
jgi:hypothetical protein